MDKVSISILILFITMFVGAYLLISTAIKKEVTTYNSINGTNYSKSDWFWSSEVLKKQNQSFRINN